MSKVGALTPDPVVLSPGFSHNYNVVNCIVQLLFSRSYAAIRRHSGSGFHS